MGGNDLGECQHHPLDDETWNNTKFTAEHPMKNIKLVLLKRG